MIESSAEKFSHVARLTLIGTGFAAAGAVMSTYVPAFHAPVEWLHKNIKDSHSNVLSKLPGGAGKFFSQNPLLNNHDITEFLAVNAMETVLVGGMIVTIGGVLGISGIPKEKLEKMLCLTPPCNHTH